MKIIKCPKCNARHKNIDRKKVKLPLICFCGYEIMEDDTMIKEGTVLVDRDKFYKAIILLDNIEDNIIDYGYKEIYLEAMELLTKSVYKST